MICMLDASQISQRTASVARMWQKFMKKTILWSSQWDEPTVTLLSQRLLDMGAQQPSGLRRCFKERKFLKTKRSWVCHPDLGDLKKAAQHGTPMMTDNCSRNNKSKKSTATINRATMTQRHNSFDKKSCFQRGPAWIWTHDKPALRSWKRTQSQGLKILYVRF